MAPEIGLDTEIWKIEVPNSAPFLPSDAPNDSSDTTNDDIARELNPVSGSQMTERAQLSSERDETTVDDVLDALTEVANPRHLPSTGTV